MWRLLFSAVLCVGLLSIDPFDAGAQENAPEGEIYAGYFYLRTNRKNFNANGWGGSITGNFNRFIGAELSVVKFEDIAPPAPAFGDYFRVLFGPHFAYHGNSRVSPFAHVLIGLTGGRQCPPNIPCFSTSDEVSSTTFTQSFGGGLDVKVTHFLWVRAIQADYVHVGFRYNTENNPQLSFGLVFRWGRVP